METVGLRPGDWLATDDMFTVDEVAGAWLYAVGDVNRRALFTHQGKYQARIAGAVIAARAHRRPLDMRRWSRFDDRDRRRGAGGAVVACGAGVPDHQRGVAAVAGDVPGLVGGGDLELLRDRC
ncbi:hypothetical protein ABH935_009581 [Catenulispora sp. GAS73]